MLRTFENADFVSFSLPSPKPKCLGFFSTRSSLNFGVYRINHTITFPQFDGLQEGQIPIFPSELGLTISTTGKPRMKIHHRQFPLTPAYGFTDQKGQGQTILPVYVDIGRVPGNFGIDPFGAYVALSRGRGRESIRLLRDFDDSIFTRHPSEDLRQEDERLRILTEQTKQRWDTGFYN